MKTMIPVLTCLLALPAAAQTLVAPAPAAPAAEAAAPTPAPTSTISREGTYAIRPGDLLQITVWKETEMDRETIVLPDGSIDFPLVGSFMAAGKTSAELQTTLTEKLKPFITAPSVTVIVKETTGNTVSVIGQVSKPGDIIMNRATTVMQALSMAGGLTPYADDDIVILRKVNGKEQSIDFDYDDVSAGHDLETNITLQPGDVVVVPTASLF